MVRAEVCRPAAVSLAWIVEGMAYEDDIQSSLTVYVIEFVWGAQIVYKKPRSWSERSPQNVMRLHLRWGFPD